MIGGASARPGCIPGRSAVFLEEMNGAGPIPLSRTRPTARRSWSAAGEIATSSGSIVAPEDATEMTHLRGFTRDLMRQMELDLATRLDWIAVDHHNTGHPHTHVRADHV